MHPLWPPPSDLKGEFCTPRTRENTIWRSFCGEVGILCFIVRAKWFSIGTEITIGDKWKIGGGGLRRLKKVYVNYSVGIVERNSLLNEEETRRVMELCISLGNEFDVEETWRNEERERKILISWFLLFFFLFVFLFAVLLYNNASALMFQC